MTNIKFWVVEENEDEIEEEEIKYSNILHEEEYEEEEPPKGFAGTQTGSNIIEDEPPADQAEPVVPWDPSQPHFFVYI